MHSSHSTPAHPTDTADQALKRFSNAAKVAAEIRFPGRVHRAIISLGFLTSSLAGQGLALAQDTKDVTILDALPETAPVVDLSVPAPPAPAAYIPSADLALEPVAPAPAPSFDSAPLPAPDLAPPVIQLTPQDLAPVGTVPAVETRVDQVYETSLEGYVPPVGAPRNTVQLAGEVDAALLAGSADAENVRSEAIASDPANPDHQAVDSQTIVIQPGAAQPVNSGGAIAQGAAAQSAGAQPVAVTSSGNWLPDPQIAPTTEAAGQTAQSSGYSITYPIRNVAIAANQSFEQLSSRAVSALSQAAPSWNLGQYFAITPRPQALMGNGDRQLLFPLSFPAPISSAFGWRNHPIFNTVRFHSGTDLAAEQGTPIVAPLSGKVSLADFAGGYGLTVMLDHADGKHQTLYGHLSELYVQPGEVVQQGTVIGRVGSTGNSTGPHLHFEIRELTNEGWVAIDPGRYLENSMARLVRSLQQPAPSLPITEFSFPLALLNQGQEPSNQAAVPTLGLGQLANQLGNQVGNSLNAPFAPATPLERQVIAVVRALKSQPVPAQIPAVSQAAPPAIAPATAPADTLAP